MEFFFKNWEKTVLCMNWRACEASETLSGVYKFQLVRYIYMEVRVTNSSTCYAYVMWAELGHCHFLYVPAVSNVVTAGNGTGTKCFKMEPCA